MNLNIDLDSKQVITLIINNNSDKLYLSVINDFTLSVVLLTVLSSVFNFTIKYYYCYPTVKRSWVRCSRFFLCQIFKSRKFYVGKIKQILMSLMNYNKLLNHFMGFL